MKNLLLIMFLMVLSSCATKPVSKVEFKNDLFTVKSSLEYMKETAIKANDVVNNAEFRAELSQIESFDYSEDNGKQVLEKLSTGHCVASTYKSRNPFSKAIATTYKNDKPNFYMNTRKNPRKIISMVNTFIHECLHILGYSHGNNSSVGKENTVNYGVGKLAEKYVK